MAISVVGVDLSKSVFQLSVADAKTDAADADALVLADRDTSLHPIPIKSEELQALQGLHRIREQWKRARVAAACLSYQWQLEIGIRQGRLGVGRMWVWSLTSYQPRSTLFIKFRCLS